MLFFFFFSTEGSKENVQEVPPPTQQLARVHWQKYLLFLGLLFADKKAPLGRYSPMTGLSCYRKGETLHSIFLLLPYPSSHPVLPPICAVQRNFPLQILIAR